MGLKHHKTLTEEKWNRFSIAQKVLQIAVEIQRAVYWLEKQNNQEAKSCLERAFELIDITIATEPKRAFRKELLRFREELGKEYISDEVSIPGLKKLYEVLIKSNGEAFRAVGATLRQP